MDVDLVDTFTKSQRLDYPILWHLACSLTLSSSPSGRLLTGSRVPNRTPVVQDDSPLQLRIGFMPWTP